MKAWKWDRFVISFIVSFLVAMMLVAGAARFHIDMWGIVFVIALVSAAAFTLAKGLLKRLHDIEYKLELLQHRLWELEKKSESK